MNMPTTERPLPYALYRAEQVRALDRCAIERHHIPGEVLMERAGAAAFGLLRARWPQARRIAVLVGPGNNGGDGYVVARLCLGAGLRVDLLQLGEHRHLEGEAALAARAFAQAGGAGRAWRALPADADLIVDGLLGTGLQRPVAGVWAQAIGAVNGARAPVLALDIPSGLSADTGAVLGAAVEADTTLSFIGLKQGMFTGRGPDCCGEIRFDGLQVPPGIYAGEILSARRLDWRKEAALLPRRRRSAHKGDCGHVLVVGGAPGMSGAARLAAEAALRGGAGLVTLATHPQHAPWLNLTRPELMVQGVDDPAALVPLAQRATVIAVGPGLGQGPWGRAFLQQVLRLERPMVLDADALNLIAADGVGDGSMAAAAADSPPWPSQWVLTPHPGEAARLLGCSVADVEANRFVAARRLQERYGGTVVLKGAGSLILGPGHRPVGVCSQGNPGMASAGMGDVLTGIIAALLGQGLSPEQAAGAGVCLHAAAGDRAARQGQRGLIAGDLIDALRSTLALAEE
ncbi:NAD(P)H-hydrate dehydratase [Thiohalocapsa marina]|uniref:Bifunctional NAD(P)H-hydrate repair enzyme n=1 Tax=Thiohalocapsa marina TaxID=424902 RepID=A0A5M8FJK0_9GAMM|nr:NAD(P)H-hydrate dehydratase [Thiohalocapsa marina]KAA6185068.1 NAD(P)H-hydrate dehydratase [Thiohalocapsa marina]